LLREFHREVLIPPAVLREVIEQGQGYPETPLIERAVQDGWLQQKPLQDENLASLLKLYLGAGEAEAIALAVQEQPDVLLLDDSEARLVARQMNLRVTGVVGVLIRAKQEKKIPSLKEALERLRSEAGFWLADHFVQRVLQVVGEEE